MDKCRLRRPLRRGWGVACLLSSAIAEETRIEPCCIVFFDALEDVPTSIVPGPSWYPLIGLEIPGLPLTGRSDIRSRVVVYTYSAVYRSVRCSDFYGLREHTSEKWMKWMSLLSQLRQPEVDLIGVSPETVRKHLVQRDSSRGSPLSPPIGEVDNSELRWSLARRPISRPG